MTLTALTLLVDYCLFLVCRWLIRRTRWRTRSCSYPGACTRAWCPPRASVTTSRQSTRRSTPPWAPRRPRLLSSGRRARARYSRIRLMSVAWLVLPCLSAWLLPQQVILYYICISGMTYLIRPVQIYFAPPHPLIVRGFLVTVHPHDKSPTQYNIFYEIRIVFWQRLLNRICQDLHVPPLHH